MEHAYVVAGTVENSNIIHLDEPLPTHLTRVFVVISPNIRKDRNGQTLFTWLDQIHEQRKKAGIRSMTKKGYYSVVF